MQMMDAMQLAAYCAKLRAKAGLTQRQLAERLDVDQREISMAENGSLTSRVGIRMRIVEELAGQTVEKVTMYRII